MNVLFDSLGPWHGWMVALIAIGVILLLFGLMFAVERFGWIGGVHDDAPRGY